MLALTGVLLAGAFYNVYRRPSDDACAADGVFRASATGARRGCFGEGILEDVLGQGAIPHAALQVAEKRALVLDEQGE